MSDEKKRSVAEGKSAAVAPVSLQDLMQLMILRKEQAILEGLDDQAIRELLSSQNHKDFAELLVPKKASAEPDADQAMCETVCESLETVADAPSPPCPTDATEIMAILTRARREFERLHRVSFSIECRPTGELGRGGQGVVYRVEGVDEFMAVRAMKVFSPRTPDEAALFAEDMDRIKTIATLIQREPQDDLVDIGWFGERNGVHVMLMQCIDGLDLQRLLKRDLLQRVKKHVSKDRWEQLNEVVYYDNGGPQLALRPAIAVYIAERVLRGLIALHKMKVVHGDIKPSNIMLNASGSVKIIDIGSAFLTTSPPRSYHFTPAYSAPEFLRSGTMSTQSDLASVGYVLIEMLSGRPLSEGICKPDESTTTFVGFNKDALLDSKLSLPDRLADLLPDRVKASDHLVELCRSLIYPDLRKRFPTAQESIVNRKGTYEFNKDLIRMNLSTCNYSEISHWLANVITALNAR